MKILFLIRSLEHGGAERQLVALANGLTAKGHDVRIAVFYGGGALEETLEGAPVVDLNKEGRWDFRFLKRLNSLVTTFQPDILHGYLGTANLISLLVRHQVPTRQVFWGLRASNMDMSKYGTIHRLHWFAECVLSRFPNQIISNSHAGRTYAEACGFPVGKIVVIPNGIDTKRFRPDKKARRRIRKEWGIPETTHLVGHVGRLDPMKDHATLLSACASLMNKAPNIMLACVGGGPESIRMELEAISRKLGIAERVLWTGRRNDLPQIYNAFDVFCLSSSFGEGFPNVLGEAMACGIPCVATDVGDAAHILGETNSCVRPNSPLELAAALQATLVNPPKASEVRRHIENNFNTDLLVQRSIALFQSAC